MKEHVIISEIVAGGGDKAYLKDMAEYLSENDPGCQIQAIVINTAGSALGEIQDGLPANVTLHVCDDWEESYQDALNLAAGAITGKAETTTIIPSGHRAGKPQQAGMQYDLGGNLQYAVEEAKTRLGVKIDPGRIEVYTEMGRQYIPGELRKTASLQLKAEIAKGKTRQYEFASKDDEPISFLFHTPHIAAKGNGGANCYFAPMSKERLRTTYRQNIISRPKPVPPAVLSPVLTISGYIPNPNGIRINFTEAHVAQALQEPGVQDQIRAFGFEKIQTNLYGGQPQADMNVSRSIRTTISHPGKIPQDEFISAMAESDIVFTSGDHSAIEALATQSKGVDVYCALFHKAEFGLNLNRALSQNPFMEETKKGLSVSKKLDLGDQDRIGMLSDVIVFGAAYKAYRFHKAHNATEAELLQRFGKRLYDGCKHYEERHTRFITDVKDEFYKPIVGELGAIEVQVMAEMQAAEQAALRAAQQIANPQDESGQELGHADAGDLVVQVLDAPADDVAAQLLDVPGDDEAMHVHQQEEAEAYEDGGAEMNTADNAPIRRSASDVVASRGRGMADISRKRPAEDQGHGKHKDHKRSEGQTKPFSGSAV